MKKILLMSASMLMGSMLFAQKNPEPVSVFNKLVTAVDLPYSYGFETPELDEWFVTNEGQGNVWERTQASITTPDASEGLSYMLYQFNSDFPANSYLYSKPLNLKAGKNLKLQFDYQGINPAFAEKMEVKIGTSATVAGQTQLLWRNEDIGNYPYLTANVDFTIPADGVYYISFRVYSDKDVFYLALDNIKVFEDLLATENNAVSGLKMYPNPVSNILNITAQKEITAVEIFDISGKKMNVEAAKGSNLKLNVSSLKAGVYIVKTTSERRIQTSKFIKK